MAKRHRITKERLLSRYGDVTLRTIESGGAMIHMTGLSIEPDRLISCDYNINKSNSRDTIAGSVRNLVERGTVESVYVSYVVNCQRPDHVTYLWTSVEDHPWNETLSEEL